ncbi:MAG: ATP-grasp fold amidoligase family protein [Phycisphaerales bacterium]
MSDLFSIPRRIARRIRGPRRNYLRMFRRLHGRAPNLDDPVEAIDKMAWLVLRADLSSIRHLADKYEVRDFIRPRIGESHLVPLLGIHRRFADIDRASLPRSFVIKCTHGCRWNERVPDRDAADWNAIGRRMESWLRKDYSRVWGESLYRGLEGRLIIEPWLGGPGGGVEDVKIFVDRGVPLGGIVHTADEPSIYTGYDQHGKVIMPRTVAGGDPPAPAWFGECLEIAAVLGRGFPAVRVDFLVVGGRIHAGEMTFLTGAGFHATLPGPTYVGSFDPREFDRRPILQSR